MPRTHADLEIGIPYIQRSELVYVLARAKKGQTPQLAESKLVLPKPLAVVCGTVCELLKGKDTCSLSNHSKAGLVTASAWTGEEASLVSYVVARVLMDVQSKDSKALFYAHLTQTTSRSLGHVIDPETAIPWDEDSSERKNKMIEDLHNLVWATLSANESRSKQLQMVAQSAQTRATKLMKQLLEELSAKHTDARWINSRYDDDGIVRHFENPHTFLAGVLGANSQYASYSTHTPSQEAFLHELALREGRKVNADLVKEIMSCYQKVKEAEKHEPVPYVFNQKVVEKVMLSGKYAPAPTEVPLPF